jgi:hypothetical protein
MLAIAYPFPPLAYTNSIINARMLRHFETSTVVISADEKGIRQDMTIEPGCEESLIACIRVPFHPSSLRKLIWKGAHFLGVPLLGKVPDNYRGWIKPTIERIVHWLNQNSFSPDLITSFGQPMSDHVIGLEMKRRLGIPWIAFFSDPWVDNPYVHDDRLTNWINLRKEKEVMAEANGVIFTSQETVDLVMSKYPTSWGRRAHVVPQSFDPRAYPKALPSTEGRLRIIRHVGNFYGPRTPAPLVKGLKRLISNHLELLSKIRFELVGRCSLFTLRRADVRSLPPDLISIRPPVDYQESLNLMATADALLLIDAPIKFNVFFPSKLADYVGAGRPILGITPPGTSAKIITQSGGWVADPRYPEEVEAMLVNYLSLPPFQGHWGEPSVKRELEIENVAKEINRIIRETVHNKKGAQGFGKAS